MVSEYWENFTYSWLERAERQHVQINDGDRFIWLWIAFNGWMRGKFGERVKDFSLISNLATSTEYNLIYKGLQNNQPDFKQLLNQLHRYEVIDMGHPDDPTRIKRYDDSFLSLLNVLYQVRCNLFHGRKNPEEDNKDFELVVLSYKILLPLFKAFLGYN
jgi:hypothetical protein